MWLLNLILRWQLPTYPSLTNFVVFGLPFSTAVRGVATDADLMQECLNIKAGLEIHLYGKDRG
jgi:hypothetical protein